MDDSQFSVLPEDLSTQAQSLRREFEARQARMMQERFAFGDSEAASAISTLLRRSGFPRRIGRIGRGGGLQFSRLLPPTSGWGSRVPGFAAASLLGKDKKSTMTGRQVLDNEALACLLILLFLDEPRLNVNRLHKVIRNFCYHEETRLSVIQSLISVLRRTSGQHPDGSCVPGATAPSRGKGPGKKSESKSSSSRSLDDQLGNGEMASSSDSTQSSVNSSWLNMSVDAALGCRARIFNVQKTGKSTAEKCATNVSINTQAASFVCKHVVDALACLAKNFPASFTPVQVKTQPSCTEKVKNSSSCNIADSPSCSAVGGEASPNDQSEAEFWNILIKLDGAFGGKKGKSSSKQTSLCSVAKSTDFNAAPIGYLMTFLSHPVIRKNPSLMDSLLRLLSVVSLSLPDICENRSAVNDGTTPTLTTTVDTSSAPSLSNDSQSTASAGRARTPESVTSSLLVETSPRGLESEPGEVDSVDGATTNPLPPQETVNEPMDVEMTPNVKVSMDDEGAGNAAGSPLSLLEEGTSSSTIIMAPQLLLAVDVLTSGACSEDGLEDATTLLLQVSRLNSDTRDAVLSLLLMGVRRLGHVLQDHISNLLEELKNYNETHGTISPNEQTQKAPLQQVLAFQRLNRPVSSGNPAARLFTEHSLGTGTGTRGGRRNTGQQRHIRSLTYDLHLPAMAALTEKTSSQNLFLRGLRVILQLRVAARKAALAAKRQEEKKKEQGELIS